MHIRDYILNVIPPTLRQRVVDLKNALYGGYKNHHYSQFGEDVVISALLGPKPGFYVDVGANHPKRYSNTALLYERGWSGINIEPNRQAIKLFKRFRPRDIHVCNGVGPVAGTLTYYRFSDPAVNTFMAETAKELRTKRWLVELPSEKITIRPLKEILLECMPRNVSADLLNIDVEGFDFEVLQSNDWTNFRPRVIAVEDHGFNPKNALESPTYKLLTEKRYEFVIRMGPTSIFRSVL